MIRQSRSAAVMLALVAAASAHARDFKYPETRGAILTLGISSSEGAQDDPDDGAVVAPFGEAGVGAVVSREPLTLDTRIAARFGTLQDNTTQEARAGVEGGLEADLVAATAENTCVPGLGGSMRLKYQLHTAGQEGEGLDGGAQASIGPAVGLVCQVNQGLLFMIQGHVRAGGLLEGREAGLMGDLEITPGARFVAAYRSRSFGAKVGGGAERSYRVLSGERVMSLTGEAEASFRSEGRSTIPWVGLGAEGRFVQITPGDAVPGGRAVEGTGWYVGAKVSGAFNAL